MAQKTIQKLQTRVYPYSSIHWICFPSFSPPLCIGPSGPFMRVDFEKELQHSLASSHISDVSNGATQVQRQKSETPRRTSGPHDQPRNTHPNLLPIEIPKRFHFVATNSLPHSSTSQRKFRSSRPPKTHFKSSHRTDGEWKNTHTHHRKLHPFSFSSN